MLLIIKPILQKFIFNYYDILSFVSKNYVQNLFSLSSPYIIPLILPHDLQSLKIFTIWPLWKVFADL